MPGVALAVAVLLFLLLRPLAPAGLRVLLNAAAGFRDARSSAATWLLLAVAGLSLAALFGGLVEAVTQVG